MMMQIKRLEKKTVWVGSVPVGGGHPIVVQSMTNTDTADLSATLAQVEQLGAAGCQIVRVGIPSENELNAFRRLCRLSPLPIIADIHFHADLAVAAIESGAQGLRLNPGNIRDKIKLERVVKCAAKAGTPIRIGVNSGSLPQSIRNESADRSESMVNFALDAVHRFEDWGFDQIKLSLKSSDILTTVRANRLLAERCPYPIHVGITEAGDFERGVVASAIGVGALLLDGIGDTIRVSLTGDPVDEIKTALQILDLLGLGSRAVADVFSCPTCARTHVDLLPVVSDVRKRLKSIPLRSCIRVAIMGCEVNGPGEAAEADAGLAFSPVGAFLFANGEKLGRFDYPQAVNALVEWIKTHYASTV